jgi:uncharacterized protein YcsI (UPF0317 family)
MHERNHHETKDASENEGVLIGNVVVEEASEYAKRIVSATQFTSASSAVCGVSVDIVSSKDARDNNNPIHKPIYLVFFDNLYV